LNFKARQCRRDSGAEYAAGWAQISFLLRNNCERNVVVAAAKHATSTLTLSKFQLSLCLPLQYPSPCTLISSHILLFSPVPADTLLRNVPTRSISHGTPRIERPGEEETLCIIRQEIPRDGGNRSSNVRFSYSKACALINPLSIRRHAFLHAVTKSQGTEANT